MSDNGKLVLVTGASRGIGLHIARKALASGYNVIGIARHENHDAGFPVLACDVSESAQVEKIFADIRKKPLYGLINAAGAASMNLFLSTPPDTMRRLVNVNLLGCMYCSSLAGRMMIRARTGRIINFSTIAVNLGLAGEASYVAAKSGVEGFTRAFAREMASFGVTVNAIAPGPVETALIAGVPEEKINALRKRQVIQTPVTPEDVWQVAEWLLGENSSSISGEILHVGGV